MMKMLIHREMGLKPRCKCVKRTAPFIDLTDGVWKCKHCWQIRIGFRGEPRIANKIDISKFDTIFK